MNTPNCTIMICYLCDVKITSGIKIGYIVMSQCLIKIGQDKNSSALR